MADFNRPSVKFVRQALRYEDGQLFWLTRPRDHFGSDQQWKIWNKRFSGKEAGCFNLQGQGRHWVRIIRLCGRDYRRSVLTWVVVKGKWPSRDVDHKDRNTRNDLVENLRLSTSSQNNANASIRKDNVSGYKGVSLHRQSGKYKAAIQVKKNPIYLGLFDTAEEAHEAYLIAARKYFGDFACDGK